MMDFFKKTTLKLDETCKRPWCLSRGTYLSYILSAKKKWHSRMEQSGREEARAAPCCPVLTWKLSSGRDKCKLVLPSFSDPQPGCLSVWMKGDFFDSISHLWHGNCVMGIMPFGTLGPQFLILWLMELGWHAEKTQDICALTL